MDMIGHKTEGVNTIREPAGSLLKQEIKTVSVVLGEEDGLVGIAPENNVIESAGKMDAWFACHGSKDTPETKLVNLEA
jgi:hypothetical protein